MLRKVLDYASSCLSHNNSLSQDCLGVLGQLTERIKGSVIEHLMGPANEGRDVCMPRESINVEALTLSLKHVKTNKTGSRLTQATGKSACQRCRSEHFRYCPAQVAYDLPLLLKHLSGRGKEAAWLE